MKILEIITDGKNDKGYFINPLKNNSFEKQKGIDTITKEDILDIINYMIDNDVEFDEYVEGRLLNPVQDIIYKNLYNNLNNIQNNKETIISEIDVEFKEAENKYSNNEDN